MMTPNYDGINNLMKEYKGSTSKKIAVVEKYRKKYDWDPVVFL